MIVVGDFLIRIGSYIVEPVRFVRRTVVRIAVRRAVVRVATASGLDSNDLQAVVAVGIYLALGTLVVVWAASMFVLVRWIVGV